ncbi:hypothetical protein Tco_1423870 [Tanacetum coccineum]
MLSLRERMELDLEARLMGKTLVLNRSLDPFFEGYIKLNDLNEPFELRRNQGDDLMPTIEEGEVIEEFRSRDDELNARIDDYPSYCDYDKKIHIDLIMEYLVNISKRHAFWSLNKDILKINYSDNQYAVSNKEDMAYLCLHSPKTTKETSSIRRIQRRPIRRIGDKVCEYYGNIKHGPYSKKPQYVISNTLDTANPADIFTLVTRRTYQSYSIEESYGRQGKEVKYGDICT